MSLQTVVKYIRLSLHLMKIGLMSAFEYRLSFFIQTAGMIFNDLCWMLCWWIFFQRFPVVRGWEYSDSMTLFGLCCFSFGVFLGFFAGVYELSRTIYRGELDYFLTLPKNVLWHVAMSRMYFSGIGDIIFGIAIFFIFGKLTLLNFVIYLLAGTLSAIGVVAFVIIVQSISFFVGNFEEAAESITWTIASFGIYPSGIFDGALKAVMCTVIPAFFIMVMPAELVLHFSLKDLGILIAADIVLVTLAIALFYKGLRRYESGSLIQTKI